MVVMNARRRYGLKLETVYYHEQVDEYRSDKDIVLFREAAQLPKAFHYGCATPTMLEDLTQDNETLLGKMKYKTRSRILKAMAMASLTVEIIEHPDEQDVISFFKHYDVFAQNMKLDSGSPEYVNEFNKMGCAHIMYVKHNHQEVLAAMVYLTFPDTGVFSYGFANFRLYEDKEMSKLSSLANMKMYWSGLLKCRESGCKTLDYGGLGLGIYDHKLDSIDYFKSGFQGRIVQLYTFYKAFTWKGYFFVLLMKLRKKNLNEWENH